MRSTQWMRSSMWMRSIRVVRASGSQCRSRNCPGFDPSILRHIRIWEAADEAVLKIPKNPPLIMFGWCCQVVADGYGDPAEPGQLRPLDRLPRRRQEGSRILWCHRYWNTENAAEIHLFLPHIHLFLLHIHLFLLHIHLFFLISAHFCFISSCFCFISTYFCFITTYFCFISTCFASYPPIFASYPPIFSSYPPSLVHIHQILPHIHLFLPHIHLFLLHIHLFLPHIHLFLLHIHLLCFTNPNIWYVKLCTLYFLWETEFSWFHKNGAMVFKKKCDFETYSVHCTMYNHSKCML